MDVQSFNTIRTWFSSMERQWEEPVADRERQAKVDVLAGFCDAVGRDPDQLISDCLIRGNDGAQKISATRRRKVWEAILEFGKRRSIEDANVVRSFFIHNGIMMQSPVGRD